jgi:hypothetical protein
MITNQALTPFFIFFINAVPEPCAAVSSGVKVIVRV